MASLNTKLWVIDKYIKHVVVVLRDFEENNNTLVANQRKFLFDSVYLHSLLYIRQIRAIH